MLNQIRSISLKSQKKVDFLDQSIDLCRFKSADFGKKDGDKAIYELLNAGFPENISIENAVATFNKIRKCFESPQIVLTVSEYLLQTSAYFRGKYVSERQLD